jgi:hypothetical protein
MDSGFVRNGRFSIAANKFHMLPIQARMARNSPHCHPRPGIFLALIVTG